MLSRRIPEIGVPNAWSETLERRRASGARLLDLTEANPTRAGLSGAEAAEWGAPGSGAPRVYEPDPRGSPAARAAVAEYYRSRGIEVGPETIVLTSGTSEGYAHLFRLLCDPGDQVLVPAPSYPLFEPLARVEGVETVAYRLEHHGRWQLDADSLARAIGPRARAVVVVEPNHPTGTCLDPGEREEVAALCTRHGLALIADEVFGDFPWAPGPGFSSWAGEEVVPSFVLSGLSKVCGLPQMKLGWIVASGPLPGRDRALAGLEWIADLFLSVSSHVQAALPRLLETRHAFRRRALDRIAANRERLRACVGRRSELEVLPATGGWVAVLRLPGRRTEEEWALELLRRDVVVHPGHFYDFGAEAYAVISLIVAEEVFAAGLERLEERVAED